MILSFKELRKRDVVNIVDGRSYGKITDLKLDFPRGILTGIVVCDRKNSGFLGLFHKCEIYIEEKRILKIGGDVILVNIKDASCASSAVIDMDKKPRDKGENIFPPPPCPMPCPPKPIPPPCPPPCPKPPVPPCPPGSDLTDDGKDVIRIDLDDY